MRVDLFIDSGAFSAWSMNVTIDIQKYIDFIKEHERYISVYANLDVIGDAEATLRNQRLMEEAGLSPLPCFHVGEDFKYLEYYVQNYDYIALGGLVGKREVDLGRKAAWLDKCFSEFICDSAGIPKVKVHGFGLTSLRFMVRYPWYSVDSTSWVVHSRMGTVLVPRYRKGKWIYNESAWKVCVSTRSPSRTEAGKHFDNYSLMEREVILEYFNMKGFKMGSSVFEYRSPDSELKGNERWVEKRQKGATERLVEIMIERGLCNAYEYRDKINVMYFRDLEKVLPEWPSTFSRKNVLRGFGI